MLNVEIYGKCYFRVAKIKDGKKGGDVIGLCDCFSKDPAAAVLYQGRGELVNRLPSDVGCQ